MLSTPDRDCKVGLKPLLLPYHADKERGDYEKGKEGGERQPEDDGTAQ
jgi:hypothetical protein